MKKSKEIFLIGGVVIVALVLVCIFLSGQKSPGPAEETMPKLAGCSLDDQECLKKKTNPQEITVNSDDRKVLMQIPQNVLAKKAEVKITPATAPKEEEPLINTFGQTYDITTDAEMLADDVIIRFAYEEEELPAGIKENDLFLVRWDGYSWQPIASDVDEENNMVLAKIDRFSVYTLGYFPISPPIEKGDVEIVRKINIAKAGNLEGAGFAVYRKLSTGKMNILGSGTINKGGEYRFNLPSEVYNQLAEGEVYIKVWASNKSVSIEKGVYQAYSTDFLPINKDDYEVKVALEGETQEAFEIFSRFAKVVAFYQSIKDPELKEAIEGAVNTQIKVQFPASKNAYVDRITLNLRDLITLEKNSEDPAAGPVGDGEGDNCAHEYSHYIARQLYGFAKWTEMSFLAGDHEPGYLAKQPKYALRENIAYFLESVFDGLRKEGLKNADPSSFREIQNKEVETHLLTFNKAIEKLKTEKNPDKIKETLKSAEKAQELIKRAVAAFNKFADNFNKQKECMDGWGGNILYSIYEDSGLGVSQSIRLEKILYILKKSRPFSIFEFRDAWIREYPNDKDTLERIYDKHGNSEYIEPIEVPNITIPDLPEPDAGLIGGKVCVPDWQCSEWKICFLGTQTRICTDSNNCNSAEGKPEESRSCESEECKNEQDDCVWFCDLKKSYESCKFACPWDNPCPERCKSSECEKSMMPDYCPKWINCTNTCGDDWMACLGGCQEQYTVAIKDKPKFQSGRFPSIPVDYNGCIEGCSQDYGKCSH